MNTRGATSDTPHTEPLGTRCACAEHWLQTGVSWPFQDALLTTDGAFQWLLSRKYPRTTCNAHQQQELGLEGDESSKRLPTAVEVVCKCHN